MLVCQVFMLGRRCSCAVPCSFRLTSLVDGFSGPRQLQSTKYRELRSPTPSSRPNGFRDELYFLVAEKVFLLGVLSLLSVVFGSSFVLNSSPKRFCRWNKSCVQGRPEGREGMKLHLLYFCARRFRGRTASIVLCFAPYSSNDSKVFFLEQTPLSLLECFCGVDAPFFVCIWWYIVVLFFIIFHTSTKGRPRGRTYHMNQRP